MTLFMLIFFAIYGGMHVYIFLKIRGIIDPGSISSIIIILFLLLMIISPVIVHLVDRSFSRFLFTVSFTWMGVVFLLVSISLFCDSIKIFNSLIKYFTGKGIVNWIFDYSFTLSFFLTVLIMMYGHFEALNIGIEKVTIRTDKLPEDIRQLKIVQVSDIHLGDIVRENRLKRILEVVKKLKPDILVSTGDLIENTYDSDGLADMIKQVSPQFGKYAVTGNHEYYSGLKQAIQFTENAGFTILRGEVRNINNIINIAGVDDETGKYYSNLTGQTEDQLLSRANDRYTILLKHRPIVSPTAFFDIQLSGHTHNGQIFPFGLITKMVFKYNKGLYKPKKDSLIYVSKGSGTWGPPFRFLSPPEVTLIELINDKPLNTGLSNPMPS